MSSLKKVVIGLVLLFGGVYVMTFFLDRTYNTERSIIIDKTVDDVFDHIRFVKHQYGFADWFASDSLLRKTYKGEDGTQGFIVSWSNEKTEISGEEEIIQLKHNLSVDFEIRFIEPVTSKTHSYMKVREVQDTQTELLWGLEGEVPFPANIILLFNDYGKAMDEGLKTLKSTLEKKTDTD